FAESLIGFLVAVVMLPPLWLLPFVVVTFLDWMHREMPTVLYSLFSLIGLFLCCHFIIVIKFSKKQFHTSSETRIFGGGSTPYNYRQPGCYGGPADAALADG